MLQLGASSVVIDGVTIFHDHADPNLFWYLPAPVRLAKRDATGEPEFTLISYRGAAVDADDRGGGFLMFEVDLQLDDDQIQSITGQLGALAKGEPVLSAVPYDKGEVQCIALNIQGAAGTTATPGAFVAVEEILGASMPALYGKNEAAFSLKLSTTGATILKQAFQQGAAPIGVIYKLTFTGLQPALHVAIEADLERCYSELSMGLEAQVYWVKVGLEAAFEHLQQTGAIKITVADFVPDGQVSEQEKWALDFFRDKLLTEWFEPSLGPGAVPTAPAPAGGAGLPRPPLTQPGAGTGASPGGGAPPPPPPPVHPAGQLGGPAGGPPPPPSPSPSGGQPAAPTGGPPHPPTPPVGGPPAPPTGGPPAPPTGGPPAPRPVVRRRPRPVVRRSRPHRLPVALPPAPVAAPRSEGRWGERSAQPWAAPSAAPPSRRRAAPWERRWGTPWAARPRAASRTARVARPRDTAPRVGGPPAEPPVRARAEAGCRPSPTPRSSRSS